MYTLVYSAGPCCYICRHNDEDNLFTSAATANRTLMAWKSNLSQDYAVCVFYLTHSSIYTHLNVLKKKKTLEKHCGEKVKLLNMSKFTFFHNVIYEIRILNPLKATFKLSTVASLNMGQSQNGVLGNGLKTFLVCTRLLLS